MRPKNGLKCCLLKCPPIPKTQSIALKCMYSRTNKKIIMCTYFSCLQNLTFTIFGADFFSLCAAECQLSGKKCAISVVQGQDIHTITNLHKILINTKYVNFMSIWHNWFHLHMKTNERVIKETDPDLHTVQFSN